MKPKAGTLPMPAHYDPAHAYDPHHHVADAGGLQRTAEAWRKQHDIPPASADSVRVHLLVVDAQADFSFPQGALFVAGRSGTGAMDAHRRLVEFIYAHLHRISEITCTLDTHQPYQIFFPSAHLDEGGNHPPAHTVVCAEELRAGRYRPNPAMAAQLGVDPAWLRKQFVHYCEQLEIEDKYRLYLWPYHCMLGSPGHTLAGVVEEARLFHSFARGAADVPAVKGDNPLSERYSVFREEVTTCWDGRPIPGAQKNTRLIQSLFRADAVLVAGLASSHCVKESLEDLREEIRARNPGLAQKVYILEDCTAPVVIPSGPDFTEEAERAFQTFADAGMHRVQSTEPLERWMELPPS